MSKKIAQGLVIGVTLPSWQPHRPRLGRHTSLHQQAVQAEAVKAVREALKGPPDDFYAQLLKETYLGRS